MLYFYFRVTVFFSYFILVFQIHCANSKLCIKCNSKIMMILSYLRR